MRSTREQFMFGTEPIEAWRLWSVEHGDAGPMLAAISEDGFVWPPEQKRAFCSASRPHFAPHLDCTCGYWSLKEPEIAQRALYDDAGVVGRVKLWGRYCEFERGYRSEYAYPAELWLYTPDADEAMRDHLASLYRVPAHLGEPAAITAEREQRKQTKARMDASFLNSAINSVMLQGTWSLAPGPAPAWPFAPYVPAQAWPEGVAKPSEFWDEIQKLAQ